MSFGHPPGQAFSGDFLIFYVSESNVRQFFAALFAPCPALHCHAAFKPFMAPWFCAVFLAAWTAFWPPAGTSSSEISWRFSSGFRKPTLGTFSPPFLRLLRPSLPWCFPVRGLWFCAVFPRTRTAFWSGTSSSETSSFSMGFRSYVRHFFAAFFAPSPSFTAMVFPRPGAVVLRGLSSPKNRVCGAGQVAPKSPHFLWVSEVTLGTFSPPFLRLLRPSLPN